ncbi:MAG: hypothetical protein ABFR53_00685 [Actinomycetota bacterium]
MAVRTDGTPTSVTMPRRTLLGRALSANALFSGTSGLVLLVGASGLDGWLGVDARVLAGIGAGLMLYAIVLSIWARSQTWLRRGGVFAIAGDSLWVAGAVALIALTSVLTTAGEVALGVVTIAVAAFAVIQVIGVVRLDERY